MPGSGVLISINEESVDLLSNLGSLLETQDKLVAESAAFHLEPLIQMMHECLI